MLCVISPALASSQETLSQSQRTISPPSTSIRQTANLVEKVSYYDDGKAYLRSMFTPEGILVEKYYYYDSGAVQKIELYDKSGDKIEESNYDSEGKLDESICGWAAKRWSYKGGILRSESTYGEDGHLTERKFYNEEGDLVDRQYVGDGAIDPYEEFNSGTVVTHETDQFYDNYGNETGSITTEVDDPDDMFVYMN